MAVGKITKKQTVVDSSTRQLLKHNILLFLQSKAFTWKAEVILRDKVDIDIQRLTIKL